MSEYLREYTVTDGIIHETEHTTSKLEFQWKIPDFFSREQKHDYRVQSPQFEFFGVECILHMMLLDGYYHIRIAGKVGSEYEKFYINCCIGLKRLDDTVYKYVGCRTLMQPSLYSPEIRLILPKTDLLENRSELVPYDFLVVTCILSIDYGYFEKPSAGTETQTEISEGTFKLAEDLNGLNLNETNCDATKIGDRESGAHRAILGDQSSDFQWMFTNESDTGVVENEDLDPDTIAYMLRLYYGDGVLQF